MLLLTEFRPWLRSSFLLMVAGGLVITGVLFRSSESPAGPVSEVRKPGMEVPRVDLPQGDVFARVGVERLEQELHRFRLTGTFQTYDFGLEGETRLRGQLALVDDLNAGQQRIVREGDSLGPFRVNRIGVNELMVSASDQEWTLRLQGVFASSRPASGEGSAPESRPPTWEDMPILERSAWGDRVAENQWLIRREAVFEYAEQMMADPRRAIELYRSFSTAEPFGEDELAGFRLKMTGERDFFTAMGLTDGDVIRRVNSMEMSNQARAEFLIAEFMRSRMNAVVLDVERNGELQKLVYVIR